MLKEKETEFKNIKINIDFMPFYFINLNFSYLFYWRRTLAANLQPPKWLRVTVSLAASGGLFLLVAFLATFVLRPFYEKKLTVFNIFLLLLMTVAGDDFAAAALLWNLALMLVLISKLLLSYFFLAKLDQNFWLILIWFSCFPSSVVFVL